MTAYEIIAVGLATLATIGSLGCIVALVEIYLQKQREDRWHREIARKRKSV